MKKWSKEIIRYFLEQNGIIETEEKEIVEYGVVQGLTLLSNLLMFLMLGVVFHNLFQGILFMSAFWPLRIYAGGYHADSRKRCYFLSTCISILIFLLLRFIKLEKNTALLLVISITCIVTKLAPIESKNRVLNKKEIYVFRICIRRIQISEICVCLISYFIGSVYILHAVFWAQSLMLILQIAGMTKNNIQSFKHQLIRNEIKNGYSYNSKGDRI